MHKEINVITGVHNEASIDMIHELETTDVQCSHKNRKSNEERELKINENADESRINEEIETFAASSPESNADGSSDIIVDGDDHDSAIATPGAVADDDDNDKSVNDDKEQQNEKQDNTHKKRKQQHCRRHSIRFPIFPILVN